MAQHYVVYDDPREPDGDHVTVLGEARTAERAMEIAKKRGQHFIRIERHEDGKKMKTFVARDYDKSDLENARKMAQAKGAPVPTALHPWYGLIEQGKRDVRKVPGKRKKAGASKR